MKTPSVVHFRSLDTFALRGVAESYGAGAAGVRLTTAGLSAYVRASRRATETPPPPPPVAPVIEMPERDEESIQRFVRAPAPVVVLPARATRAPSPSLATIELGLRKPTTWAVLLLTLGVAFGVVIARVATSARLPNPAANALAAAAPAPGHAPAGVQPTPTLPTTVIRAEPSSLAAPQAHASSAQTRARHSRAHRLALLAASGGEANDGAESADTSGPREKREAALAATPEPAPVPEEADDSVGAASAASARAQRELSDSL